MTKSVPTTFMIISDTHNFKFGDADKFEGGLRLPTPKVDVLLHCGDLTGTGGPKAYEKALKMLGAIDAELKLVIAGNHDLDLDKMFVDTHPGKWFPSPDEQHRTSYDLMTGRQADEAGVTYLEEGLSSFTLENGAQFNIYTSPYQPFFCDWAFSYFRDQDRYNPHAHVEPGVKCIAKNPIPDAPNVDILMTHGPPKGILDETYKDENVGCAALMKAVSRAKPLLHCFGHIHEGWGATQVNWEQYEKQSEPDIPQIPVENTFPDTMEWKPEFGKDTLFVNASIMNLRYKPTNRPFLIELGLRAAT